MTEEGQQQKRKAKKRQKQVAETPLDIAETFDPSTAKDKDFDLDLDAAKFQGKKGQAGTRTRTPKDPDAGDPRGG